MQNDFASILNNERKQLLNVLRSTRFSQLNKDYIHQQIIPLASYAPWENDEAFVQLMEAIKNNTLVDKYRCYELWDLAKQVAPLTGDVVEVGVWKGGTGALIAKASESNPNSVVYLCDTFEGVVKAGDNDTNYKGGEHADTSEHLVMDLLKANNSTNAVILKGIFPDDFQDQMQGKSYKFCHIDVDTYGSAKGVFDYIWPNLVVGGVVAFDDYGIWGCEGVTKMFNEIQVTNATKLYNLNGHGVIIKNSL
jgi:O-methyltransferase